MSDVKKCLFCAEEIKADAAVCKHCGREQQPQAAPKSKRGCMSPIILAIIAAFVVVGGCLFIVLLVPSGDRAANEVAESGASVASQADAVQATHTPRPTATPLPSSPPYSEIRGNAEGMTDVQWNAYQSQVVGTIAEDWTGWVSEVTAARGGKYTVRVDMDPPGSFSVSDVTIEDVPEELAFRLNKDQSIRFTGRISSARYSVLFGMDIRIADATIEITD
jgi:hypothetical protein